jgi:hypothetical protein
MKTFIDKSVLSRRDLVVQMKQIEEQLAQAAWSLVYPTIIRNLRTKQYVLKTEAGWYLNHIDDTPELIENPDVFLANCGFRFTGEKLTSIAHWVQVEAPLPVPGQYLVRDYVGLRFVNCIKGGSVADALEYYIDPALLVE